MKKPWKVLRSPEKVGPLPLGKGGFKSIIVQINGIDKIDKFFDASSGKGACDYDMPCAGVMEEKFRLLGGNIFGIRLCHNADYRFCKAHGKHLGQTADIVSAVVAEADYIRIISRSDCGSAAEKRSIGIFPGGIDGIGPCFDGLGFVIGHIKVMKAADKSGFSTAGTPHKDYLAGFYLLRKAEGTVIFFPVLRVHKSGIYGIFFGHSAPPKDVNLYDIIISVFADFFNRFYQKGFICVPLYGINKL